MSAIYCDPQTVAYLVQAATSASLHFPKRPQTFRWFHWETWHELPPQNPAAALAVAQMLDAANLESCRTLYPSHQFDTTPLTSKDIAHEWQTFDPVQVLKTCDYFEYQSDAAPTWPQSSARHFITTLREHAIRALPGYNLAQWGNPEPTPNPATP